MATPTRTWLRLARRLRRDDNPLRRRSDRIEAWLLPAALAGVVALSPLVAGATALWVHADSAAARHAAQSWRQFPAVLQRAAPGPQMSDGGANSWLVWTQARWTADGQQHHGQVPARARSRAGSTVAVWIDRAGHVRLPPPTAAEVANHLIAVVALAVAVLAVGMAGIALIFWRVLDRRRLASWETAWLSVGPDWSDQA